MIRWLITALSVFTLYKAALWLMDHPGQVVVDWLGLEITLHMAAIATALLLFTLIVGYSAILLWRLATWPTRRRARKHHRTFKRGLEQLTRGVTALAMGDETLAEEALKKARAALPGEALPQLLTAQLLQRQGKHGEAHGQFRLLMAHPATSGLATRKMIEQHIAHREWAEALHLIEEAQQTTPRDSWLTLTQIDLSARAADAPRILALTEGWGWQSPLTKEQRHRYAALGHYLTASQPETPRAKRESALRHAIGYAPDFLPAISAYADLLCHEKRHKQARKTLLAAWHAAPASALIAPIIASLADEPAEHQWRLLKPFLKNTTTSHHQQLEAGLALSLGDHVRARTVLEPAARHNGTRDMLLLMAEIERAAGDTHAANNWTARAVNAPAGEAWVCERCGQQHDEWQSHCRSCDSFDTLRFEHPQARITSVDISRLD